MKIKLDERLFFILFFISIATFYLLWMIIVPFGEGPDEAMRYEISTFIFKHGHLPVGSDPEIRHPYWGNSYAFTPITPYILSGYIMKVINFFTKNTDGFLYVARTVTVAFSMATVAMTYLISKLIFINNKAKRWLFITFVACLPQFAFISCYVNVDSFAIFCTSLIIYSWLLGLKDDWSYKSCFFLALGLGLCLISYYNAYGYLVVSTLLFLTCLIFFSAKRNIYELLKKSSFIMLVAFVISGWWFIRNAILYDGDILGLSAADECAEMYAIDFCKPSKIDNPNNLGQSFWFMLKNRGWLRGVGFSVFAAFGNMDIRLHYKHYLIYFTLCVLATLGCLFVFKIFQRLDKSKQKKAWIFTIAMFLSFLFPIAISMYYSYFNDFQPQGRYILPGLLPMSFFFSLGIGTAIDKFMKNKFLRNISYIIIYVILALLSVYSLLLLINHYC